MNIAESIKIAFRSLSANKLRAALTMLGIIIGVAAVITLLSVGQGVQVLVQEQIQSIGSNLLFVVPGNLSAQSSRNAGSAMATSTINTLTYGDAKAIADPQRVPDVQAVAVESFINTTVVYRDRGIRTSVSGTTVNYPQVRNHKVAEGTFFSEEDFNGGSRVAVLGHSAAEALFPDGYAVGQTIKIKGISFRVIGVLASKGGTGFGGVDDSVFVPLTTFHTKLTQRRSASGDYVVSAIYAQAVSESRMEAAMEQIAQLLRDRHGILYESDDDFTVINQKDILNIFGEITSILTIFLGAIAAISLLVGGIGIMNIMLVSVTERTREIGLRKAVGARRRDVLWQFLIEAMVLSLAGGFIGIALGAVGSQLVGQLSGSLQPVITVSTVLLATGFSAAVGLFFGIYPASRAAALNPIDALRYE
ncbi:MAG: ABC transporter permease [Chloroflexi bacterium]|nr:ABC transporter permease [Chloroflexota bacterium]